MTAETTGTLSEEAIRAVWAATRQRGLWQLGQAGSCNVVDYDGDDISGVAYVAYEPNAIAIAIAAAPAHIAWLLDALTAALVETLDAAIHLAHITGGLESLAADAMRYRFIQNDTFQVAWLASGQWRVHGRQLPVGGITRPTLDAAIDAAIAGGEA